MDLRALIISHIDSDAPEQVSRPHQSAVSKLADLLTRYNITTEILDMAPSPLSSVSSTANIIFILSPMTCWYPGLRRSVDLVRQNFGKAPVIVVETAFTLSLRHALETSGADYIHKGEIGEALGFILKTFGYRLKRKVAPI